MANSHRSKESYKKQSELQVYKSQDFRDKCRIAMLSCGGPTWMICRKPSKETRLKLSEANRGEKSYLWKGGLTKEHARIRKSVHYKIWRESVFKRDNYTCVFCKKIGGTLNADHIKPFAIYSELRFSIDNGRTLCVSCHRKTETFGEGTRKMMRAAGFN